MYIELVRRDLRQERRKIIGESLDLKQSEAEAFWPVYERYEAMVGHVEPMRRRLAEVPFSLDHPWWIEDPHFDIDFHVRDSMGRSWQCGTIQLDYSNPERFDLTYVGEDNAQHRPPAARALSSGDGRVPLFAFLALPSRSLRYASQR